MAEDTISALSVYYIYSTVSEAQKHSDQNMYDRVGSRGFMQATDDI